MKRATLPLTAIILLALSGGVVALPCKAGASSTKAVISEVMTGDTSSQSKEFVELFNMSGQPLDIGGWTIEYKSATGKTWYKRASMPADTEIASNEYFVLDTESADLHHLTSGMAQTGGNLRLRDASGVVVDQLAWGDGDSPEKAATGSAPLGQSIARNLPSNAELLTDTDDNSADFHLSTSLTPGKSPADEVEINPDGGGGDPPPTSAAAVVLSELFPDPTSPLTDSKDEYIELYNEGDSAVDLIGWSLRDKSGHVYRLASHVVGSHEFYALKSAVTKISLNNDGDEVSLLDPSGVAVDSSPNYGHAKPGLSWGLSEGGWAWLSAPSPGASNASPITDDGIAASNGKKKSSTAKNSFAKTKATAKAKKPSSKKTSKLAKSAAATTGIVGISPPVQNARLWSWLLIALGVGTIGYGIYAYRPEITHFIHKLRAKFSSR